MIIPIVFCSDNNYVPYMATAIQTVFENSSDNYTYQIFVLHKDITSESEFLLKEIVKSKDNFNIELVDVGESFLNYNLYVHGISVEAYYRLIIPYYFQKFEKVLYLDCDLLCLGDVSELYNFDVSGKMVGCIQGIAEIGWYNSSNNHYWDNLLKLKNPENYFNSGVLLFNTKKFSEEISFEELLKLAEKENWICYDQDVLNIVCEGKATFFPYYWNFIKYPTIDYVSNELKDKYYSAEKTPKIVHFASGYKPWGNERYVPYALEFWKYATRTPFSIAINSKFNERFTMYVKTEMNVESLPILRIFQIVFRRIKNKIFQKS